MEDTDYRWLQESESSIFLYLFGQDAVPKARVGINHPLLLCWEKCMTLPLILCAPRVRTHMF